jgi:hypothetical protein
MGSASSRTLGCRSRASELASFFSLSITSSCARFSCDAPERPPSPAPPGGSSDFFSKTKTETALPVDFFFASYIFHGPEYDDGLGSTV